MKQKILSILKNSPDYISGEQISNMLGISRTAVWKNINKLRSEGYEIESVTNRGYRIVKTPDIVSGLLPRTEFIGQNVSYIYETDSTNQEAKRNFEMPDGTVFVSEVQNGGKGRLGRGWSSPAGVGIWMSILLKPDIPPGKVSAITLAAGLAVAEAIPGSGIKWPNDVVIGGKKICGILTEMSAEMERVNYVVTGIGVNVNIEEFPADISEKATSLLIETGERHSRADLAERILENFEAVYKRFLEKGFSGISREYKRYCVTLNKEVNIIDSNESVRAYAVDIDDDGGLIVEINGKKKVVTAGEVSVRGIYGYI